jgi:hypothetical protein
MLGRAKVNVGIVLRLRERRILADFMAIFARNLMHGFGMTGIVLDAFERGVWREKLGRLVEKTSWGMP